MLFQGVDRKCTQIINPHCCSSLVAPLPPPSLVPTSLGELRKNFNRSVSCGTALRTFTQPPTHPHLPAVRLPSHPIHPHAIWSHPPHHPTTPPMKIPTRGPGSLPSNLALRAHSVGEATWARTASVTYNVANLVTASIATIQATGVLTAQTSWAFPKLKELAPLTLLLSASPGMPARGPLAHVALPARALPSPLLLPQPSVTPILLGTQCQMFFNFCSLEDYTSIFL